MSEHPFGTSGLCRPDSTSLPLPPSTPQPLPTGWPPPPGPVAPLNPFRPFLCAYEVFKDLPNYRVTEHYPFDNSSWLARHDLTSWLVQQMNVNASGPVAQTLRDSLKSGPAGVVAANAGWTAMVLPNGPWDFKPDILDRIGRSIILADTWYV
jgi:hypothetical protein